MRLVVTSLQFKTGKGIAHAREVAEQLQEPDDLLPGATIYAMDKGQSHPIRCPLLAKQYDKNIYQ